MITILAWNPESNCVEKIDAARLMTERARLVGGKCVWIDLASPTLEEEALVLQEFLPIHSLSFEDVTRLRRKPDSLPHHPKVEEFPDYLFVIVNPLTPVFLHQVGVSKEKHPAVKPFTQLSGVLTQTVIVTHHYEPLQCIDQVQAYLQRHQGQCERGPDFVFHLILDCAVDQYAPVLDYVDLSLDNMETHIVQRPRPALFVRLLRLKREIVLLRKTLIHEREVLVRLARGEFALVDEREMVYYRNVYDHLVRFGELIESSRDMVSDLMQSYLAAASNRLNEIMKVLTMISTIVLPMTLIAGIYGMNFDVMPEIKWDYGYPFALGLMALTAIGAIAFFLWRKWL
ncbi:MAG: magnesium/cobalt transporter CorA [Gemmataceae bacterium]|nr:magnesium/cobalt transporter CorA [Gemmataceae bacterium]